MSVARILYHLWQIFVVDGDKINDELRRIHTSRRIV